MNPIGLPFVFLGVVTIACRTVEIGPEYGPPTTVIEGPPAVLIGAVLTTIGLVVTFFV